MEKKKCFISKKILQESEMFILFLSDGRALSQKNIKIRTQLFYTFFNSDNINNFTPKQNIFPN